MILIIDYEKKIIFIQGEADLDEFCFEAGKIAEIDSGWKVSTESNQVIIGQVNETFITNT